MRHITLLASREVIVRRLATRGDGPDSWPVAQVDRCLEALDAPMFAHHIDTESRSVEDVAEEILHVAELKVQDQEWIDAGISTGNVGV